MSSKSFDLNQNEIIRAGAGTGKTTTLIRKVYECSCAFHKENEERWPKLLITTFTRKAVAEIKEKLIEKAIEEKRDDFLRYVSSENLRVLTIDGVIHLFLRMYGRSLGIGEGFSQVSDEQMKVFMKHEIFEDLRKKTKEYQKIYELMKISRLTEAFFSYEEFQKTYNDVSPFHLEDGKGGKNLDEKMCQDEVDAFLSFQKLADSFLKEFESYKKDTSRLRIRDFEIFSLEIVRRFPKLAKDFSLKWDHWFIDEYQDTSAAQEILLNAFRGDKGHFVVGDPQQSIYYFRGAKPGVFGQKEEKIASQKGSFSTLKTNHRSHPDLVCFFNEFFKDFPDYTPLDKKDAPSKKRKQRVSFSVQENKDDEMKSILNQIKKWRSEGVSFKDISILSRTNRDLKNLGRYLQKNKIPAVIEVQETFFKKIEIKDALIFLKFLINPHDDKNLLALLRSPFFRISDKKLSSMVEENEEKSLWSLVFKEKKEEVFQKLKEHLEKANVESPFLVWKEGLKKEGYFDSCYLYDPSGKRESNLWKLIHLLKQKQGIPGFNFIQFIRDCESDFDKHSEAQACFHKQSVTLMTIHKSKGLSIPYVILPFLSGNFKGSSKKTPFIADEEKKKWALKLKNINDSGKKGLCSVLKNQISKKEKEEREKEEKRLLYVALTRAGEEIFLSWNKEKDKGRWSSLIEKNFFKDSLEEGIFDKDSYIYEIKRSLKEEKSSFEEDKEKTFLKKDPLRIKKEKIKEKVKVTDIIGEEERKNLAFDLKQRLLSSDKGSRLHQTMEAMRYNKDNLLWGDEMKKYVLEEDQIPLKELMEKGQAEWGFQVKNEEKILEGRIDLWGWDQKGDLWVVDYKTGSEKKIEEAFRQLNIYSWALEKMGKRGKKTHLCVLFPLTKKVYKRQRDSLKEIESFILMKD